MFHHKLLSDGAQIEGVVLRNDTPSNITKDRLTIGVKFDDGQRAEFTEDVVNYYEPEAHTLKGFVDNLVGNNVIPVSLTPGDKIPVRYDPDDRRNLAIDVPALHERVLQRWTQAQAADRARAEAVLAAQPPGGPQMDESADDLEALVKLEGLHGTGSLSDEEFAAAKRKLLGA